MATNLSSLVIITRRMISGGSAPPSTGSLLTNRITSSVYSYLRSISTAGGCPHPFFTLHLSSSRDFPYLYNIVLVFEYTTFSRTFIYRLRFMVGGIESFPPSIFTLFAIAGLFLRRLCDLPSFYASDSNITRD